MAKLDFHQQVNPAAMARLKVCPALLLEDKITSVPLCNGITLTSADKWLEIYCSPQTLEFQEPSKPTADGELYETRISGFHPGQDADRITLFNMMYHYRWAAQVTDTLGVTRQIGGKGEWLDVSFAFGIAADMAGDRGTGIMLQGTFTAPGAVV